MTTTVAINGQSIGTSTNIGEDKFPQKVTAQTLSDRFFIEGKIVNGADAYDPSNRVVVWYASCSESVTAAASVDLLRNTARRLEVVPSRRSGVSRTKVSDCEPLSGGYIYLWTEVPKLATASTLTVSVIEGP